VTSPVLRVALVVATLACAAAPAAGADDWFGGGVGRGQWTCGAERPGAVPAAHAARVHRTIGRAIVRAYAHGAITAGQRDDYLATLHAARAARSRLGGVRGTEMAGALAIADDLARRNALTSSRMPVLFLTLQRNAEYWSAHSPPPLPPSGQPCVAGVGYSLPRITFGDDPIVFQWYPGHGLQIQWLGNFGKANALANECLAVPPQASVPCRPDKLKALLDRLVELSVQRGGYTAWEYTFPFGGGAPPWVSGMAQATALQALARASKVLGDPHYLDVGRGALGAFRTGPPVGIRVFADGGDHFLIYSFAPGTRVLNAFLQSLIGLYDYAQISGDETAKALFDAGDRAARREVPRYDTGAWSLYSLGEGEANLDYHKLVRDLLQRLCDRTQAAVYCDTARRFTGDLKTPPVVAYAKLPRAHRHKAATVLVRISKVSCVKVAVYRARTLVYVHQYVFTRGLRSFTFVPPARGDYRLIVDARDLAGNRTVQREGLRVR